MTAADTLYERGNYREALMVYQSDKKPHLSQCLNCVEYLYGKDIKNIPHLTTKSAIYKVKERLASNSWLCDLVDVPNFKKTVLDLCTYTDLHTKHDMYHCIAKSFSGNARLPEKIGQFICKRLAERLGDPDNQNIVSSDFFQSLGDNFVLTEHPLIKEENGYLSFQTKEVHNYFIGLTWADRFLNKSEDISNPLWKGAHEHFMAFLSETQQENILELQSPIISSIKFHIERFEL